MARKSNFDRQEKLLEAMELFWQRGYANTAISDLVDTLKINRFSLYNTFGDKQSLYYEALDAYLNSVSFPSAQTLDTSDADWTELRTFLISFAKLQRRRPCGCFMQNALVEHAGQDDQVLSKGHHLFDFLLQRIECALHNGQKNAKVRDDLSSHQLACLILNQMQGMRVLGKAKRYQDLDNALECLLLLVESPNHERH